MAYVHCHACSWSQDDYWDFRFRKYGYWKVPLLPLRWAYNPVSCSLSYLTGKHGYLWPRRIDFDDFRARENGWKRRGPHSWWLIGFEFNRMMHKFRNMKWRTMDEFRADPNKVCPKCGSDQLDID